MRVVGGGEEREREGVGEKEYGKERKSASNG